jgi:histidyl-tRNA synthetase
MKDEFQSTDAYKGVRDFYPADMAIQQYIFDQWSKTAESFGYERYDASVLEPATLYKAKGAVNEEIVKDQTYTFVDRGDREVTLRPEMTPSVARMIAKKQKELAFPIRWYSIPNIFRYERPQKGRLREHWQLNCDIFGSKETAADIEIILLAYQTLLDFGASPEMFEIRLNDRSWMNERFDKEEFTHEQRNAMLYLLDRKEKIDNFAEEAEKIAGRPFEFELTEPNPDSNLAKVKTALMELGVKNVKVSLSTVRGFDYYTGIIFEIYDVSGENNRSLLGGGRYDNLTSMFGGAPVPGVGFGMGDVTMRDFLETHNLLPKDLERGVEVVVIPTDESYNLYALLVAQKVRGKNSVSIDFGTKKMTKKIGDASTHGSQYIAVIGDSEMSTGTYKLKNLTTGEETEHTL